MSDCLVILTYVPPGLLSLRPLTSMTAWTTRSIGSSECPTKEVETWKLWDDWRGWWTNWKRCGGAQFLTLSIIKARDTLSNVHLLAVIVTPLLKSEQGLDRNSLICCYLVVVMCFLWNMLLLTLLVCLAPWPTYPSPRLLSTSCKIFHSSAGFHFPHLSLSVPHVQ